MVQLPIQSAGVMRVRIWDVEHGACAMLQHARPDAFGREVYGPLAMIDSGSSASFSPSKFIRNALGRSFLDYLFITNADQDHMSDLQGLSQAGIQVETLIRNVSYTGSTLRAIKRLGGPLTGDAEWYAAACESFSVPTPRPFDDHMNGIVCKTFCNPFPQFTDTNNLSLAVFIRYRGVTLLFPGDLERQGWLALLVRQDFRDWLSTVDVMMASHHGRESGYCDEVFDICRPQAIIVSDKPIQYETQRMLPDYRAVVQDKGVVVRTTMKRRHVLTTRRDGWIQIEANENGYFSIDTEHRG